MRISILFCSAFIAYIATIASVKKADHSQLLPNHACLKKYVPPVVKKCGEPGNTCTTVLEFAECTHRELESSCDLGSAIAYVKSIEVKVYPGNEEDKVCNYLLEYVARGGPSVVFGYNNEIGHMGYWSLDNFSSLPIVLLFAK